MLRGFAKSSASRDVCVIQVAVHLGERVMQGAYRIGSLGSPVTPAEGDWERTRLVRGERYRVIKPFRDADGDEHPIGEEWIFVSSCSGSPARADVFDESEKICQIGGTELKPHISGGFKRGLIRDVHIADRGRMTDDSDVTRLGKGCRRLGSQPTSRLLKERILPLSVFACASSPPSQEQITAVNI